MSFGTEVRQMSSHIREQGATSPHPTLLQSFTSVLLGLSLIAGILLIGQPAGAGDMPHAAGSPSAGISFDDRPLMLPVQRNFQMAMLTASSEMGRTCGQMEAYGWRMNPNEQQRVNQVFNNTVDRLRAQGFMVESKSPTSVSRDVTMFTADRPDKHLIFMWSAGEIGLVMVLCETSAPIASTSRSVLPLESSMTPPPSRSQRDAAPGNTRTLESALPLTKTGKKAVADFSPVGDWVGSYTCHQGTTGGTLRITNMRGNQFEGTFRFYPTPKNAYVPAGRYNVYGDYDGDTYRILINPGKWLERPNDYYNTIMIGSFDPVAHTFSGYFQGINGCTSFEAHYSSASTLIDDRGSAKAKNPAKKVVKKKTKAVKKAQSEKAKPADVQPEMDKPDAKADSKVDAKVDVKPEPEKAKENASSVLDSIKLPAKPSQGIMETPGIKLYDPSSEAPKARKAP
jgi:hypothetical protein